jgi:hypothetical protein
MRVRVPVIVKDPGATMYREIKLTRADQHRGLRLHRRPGCTTCHRARLRTRQRRTGPTRPVRSSEGPNTQGSYDVPHPVSMGDPDIYPVATAVSAFGAVQKTCPALGEWSIADGGGDYGGPRPRDLYRAGPDRPRIASSGVFVQRVAPRAPKRRTGC